MTGADRATSLIFVNTTFAPILLNGQPYVAPADSAEDFFDCEVEPHCYACGRHTDHVGEHDTLVALGLVIYREGEVVLTEFGRWAKGEPGLWSRFSSIEYAEYRAHMAW